MVPASSTDIRAMFDRIAPTYDLLNKVMSAGVDRRWRERAIASLRGVSDPVLDLCAGTLDFSAMLMKSGENKARRVIAVDFSAEMLARGKTKAPGVETVVADAKALPFEDESFGAVVCGFGIRNVKDLGDALDEVHRVLRPGGMFVTLDFFQPTRVATRAFHRVFEKWAPALGGTLAKDREAYAYLARSIVHFQKREEYESLLRGHGFVNVSGEDLTLGVASIVRGEK